MLWLLCCLSRRLELYAQAKLLRDCNAPHLDPTTHPSVVCTLRMKFKMAARWTWRSNYLMITWKKGDYAKSGSFVRNSILLFLQTFHSGLQYHILQEIIKVGSRFMVICSGNSRLKAISQIMLHKDKMSNFILQAKQTWQPLWLTKNALSLWHC